MSSIDISKIQFRDQNYRPRTYAKVEKPGDVARRTDKELVQGVAASLGRWTGHGATRTDALRALHALIGPPDKDHEAIRAVQGLTREQLVQLSLKRRLAALIVVNVKK